MKLYLSSYKLGNRIDELKDWVKNNNNNIVLIENSRDVYEESEIKRTKINEDIKSLEDLGFKVQNIDLKQYFGKNEKLVKDIKQYKSFYVIGGNTFALRLAMKLSGFDEYLKSIVDNPTYLYAGYSAGICVLSPKLEGLDIVDEPVNPYNIGDIIYDGLGILNYVPVPHYKSDHPESKLVDDVVSYMEKNKIKYKTLRDGDVIIEEVKKC